MNSSTSHGPVIWTSLYVAALVLTWATLLSFERFGETEVKSWAPLIQAVLSAGAIYSAWWLQDRKRRADRAEAVSDTITATKEHVRLLEISLRNLISLCRSGKMQRDLVRYLIGPTEATVGAIRAINVGHMPNAEAVSFLVIYQHNAGLFLSALEYARDQEGEFCPSAEFDVNWRQLFSTRTALFETLGLPLESDRTFEVTPKDPRDLATREREKRWTEPSAQN